MLRLMVVKRLLLLAVVPLLAACGGALGEGTADSRPAVRTSASPSPASSPVTLAARTGPVEAQSSAASCVEGYSPTTLRHRAFAFDGTVVAVRPGGTNRPDKGRLDTAAVTLTVNEWFKGGAEDTTTVDLMAPDSESADDIPLYGQGTRLLVSGEPRWGGEPLDDAIAWSCGGFTSYYDTSLADEWRAALTAANVPTAPAG
jgi:hypothetical protein